MGWTEPIRTDVDVWVAVVGLAGVIGAALVSRWPAMTAEGRLRESIARDAALWSTLPPGRGRDEFAQHIAERTQELRAKRADEGDVGQRAWVAATSLFGLAYLFLAGAASFGSDEDWISAFAVPTLLLSFGLAAVFLAVVATVSALVLWSISAVRSARRWWKRRSEPDASCAAE